MTSDFQYIVERPKPNPICFGSKLPRSTNPVDRKAMSPFQRRMAIEIYPNIGPDTYNPKKYKHNFFNCKGYGSLVSKTTRLKDSIYVLHTPSPTKYISQRDWASVKKAYLPFGKSLGMKYPEDKLPGPGTYKLITKKCRRTRFLSNLGYPSMIPVTECNCIAVFTDTCHKCGKLCDYGDYWHKNHELYLCHFCWDEEKYSREIYSEKGLKEFKKIRNCSFYHSHEETNAAIRVMTQRKINKKIRLENYLDLYIKCKLANLF